MRIRGGVNDQIIQAWQDGKILIKRGKNPFYIDVKSVIIVLLLVIICLMAGLYYANVTSHAGDSAADGKPSAPDGNPGPGTIATVSGQPGTITGFLPANPEMTGSPVTQYTTPGTLDSTPSIPPTGYSPPATVKPSPQSTPQPVKPAFGWGDIIQDLDDNLFCIYNENMETSGNYLVYDLSTCPDPRKIWFNVEYADANFIRVDHKHPDYVCTGSGTASTSCGITGTWKPTKSYEVTSIPVYIRISENRIESYRNEMLKNQGTWEITAPNTIHVVWTNAPEESIVITADCRMSPADAMLDPYYDFVRET